MQPLWPMQNYGIEMVLGNIAAGVRRLCVTAPTGCGKSRMMAELARLHLLRNERVVLYTNRKLLLEQTSGVMEKLGLVHGTRASGHFAEKHHAFQVASIQTEHARSIKKETWKLHDAKLVLIDEAHIQRGAAMMTVMKRHLEAGSYVVGFTATPIDLADSYDKLIIAGYTSEGRECGALVPAIHYGPDEPDLKHIGRVNVGEDLTEKQNVRAIMTPTIFARVFEWWNKLNPDAKPTLLFAPGVAESVWFAEQFKANGVRAAHIDGEEVWLDGEIARSSRSLREQVLTEFKDGHIQVITNRFVMREGLDLPQVEHLILATVIGSLQSYIQIGGRGLRASPGKELCTIQDHGGNWHRHGSINADREWELDMTGAMYTGMRADRLREKKEREPVRCPQCGMILAGLKCKCGFTVDPYKKSRPVVQIDGSLKEYVGDIFKARRTAMKPDSVKLWTRMYHRARNGDMSFKQAEGLFVTENHYWPDHSMPFMPREKKDWYCKVSEVPKERLQ